MVDYAPLQRVPGSRKDHDRVARTICQECSVGCGLRVFVKDDCIMDVQGDEDHPVSRGRLCPKGVAFVQGVSHPQRITLPAVRSTAFGPFESSTSWDKALDGLAERLRRIRDQKGPEALLIGCDPHAGLDFYLGARRFARLWGTPHLYHPWQTPAAEPPLPLTSPAAVCSDWLSSRCLLLVEADLAVTHPVAFGRVLEAQQQGTKIIAADTRFTTTLSKADLALVISPGSGNLLGLGLTQHLLAQELTDQDAIAANFDDPEAWKASFTQMSAEELLAAAGLAPGQMTHLARMLKDLHPATVITARRLAHRPSYGIWLTLATAMGWTGALGGGWYPLEAGLPPLDVESDLEGPEMAEPAVKPAFFGGPEERRSAAAAASDLDLSALICSANLLADELALLQKKLKQIDLVVNFSAYPHYTSQQAHVVIPPAAWAEKDALCFSNDCAIQYARAVLAPREACRSGLDFWLGLAQRMGWQEDFDWRKPNGEADHFTFYQWLLRRCPDTAACDLNQVAEGQEVIRWPLGDRPLLRAEPPLFTTESGTMAPTPLPATLTAPAGGGNGDGYPLYFQSTRMVSRSGEGSHWWPWTEELENDQAVQIHPDIAAALSIENGDEIVVAGARDALEGQAWISRMVAPTMVWSHRPLTEVKVLIHKKGQAPEQALNIIRELLQ